jgi:hypothetical protein
MAEKLKSSKLREQRIKDKVKANLKTESDKKTVKKAAEGKKGKAKQETNKVGIRKGTVLETIFDCFEKGSTFPEILEACKKAHPERDPEAMSKTIRLQIFRMPKEKFFVLRKLKAEGEAGVKYKLGEITGKPAKDAKAEKPAKKKGKKTEAEETEEEEEEEESEEEEEDEDEA